MKTVWNNGPGNIKIVLYVGINYRQTTNKTGSPAINSEHLYLILLTYSFTILLSKKSMTFGIESWQSHFHHPQFLVILSLFLKTMFDVVIFDFVLTKRNLTAISEC